MGRKVHRGNFTAVDEAGRRHTVEIWVEMLDAGIHEEDGLTGLRTGGRAVNRRGPGRYESGFLVIEGRDDVAN